VMDEKDPNYDSDSLDNGDVTIETIVPQLSHAEINKHLEPIILEYYGHGDTKEVCVCLLLDTEMLLSADSTCSMFSVSNLCFGR